MFSDTLVIYRRKLISFYRKSLPTELRKMEIARLYKKYQGRKLDWANLISYTEKMQWIKLFAASTEKARLVDKYLVRQWVSDRIGEQYLIPLLGVWDRFDDIPFDKLPPRFVLKTNHGSGTNIIVKDKSAFDIANARSLMNGWLSWDYAYASAYEMNYHYIKPRIIAEQYMEDSSGELKDYKFLCFDGTPRYIWVDVGRFHDHRKNIYDINWELQPWTCDFENTSTPIEKPPRLNEMLEIAKKLSSGFDHARVDLYLVSENIYFGEMTFTNGSGLIRINPTEYDIMLGGLWDINGLRRSGGRGDGKRLKGRIP